MAMGNKSKAELSKQNLKSTGVHNGMEVERWFGVVGVV